MHMHGIQHNVTESILDPQVAILGEIINEVMNWGSLSKVILIADMWLAIV